MFKFIRKNSNEKRDKNSNSKPTSNSFRLNQIMGPAFIVDAPDQVSGDPNSQTDVPVEVYNYGDGSGFADVWIEDHTGAIVGSQTVWLDPDQTATVSFTITIPSTPGSYTWYAKVDDISYDEDPFTVVSNGPLFDLIDEQCTTSVSVKPTQVFTVNYAVHNKGTQSGDCFVRLYDHADNLVDQKSHTLDVCSTTTGTLTGTAPVSVGTYTWKIVAYNFNLGTTDDTIYVTVTVKSPIFEITDYTSSISARPNESITINYTVANTGNEAGTVIMRLKDEAGNIIDTKSHYIDAGGSVSDYFLETAPSTAGTYTWTLEAYNETTGYVDDSKTITITVTPKPIFDLIDEECTQFVEVRPGESFSVNYAVWNAGDVTGTCDVILYDHNGSQVDLNRHVIDVGATVTGVLEGTAPSTPGDYTWLIKAYNVDMDRVDDSVSVFVTVLAPPKFEITSYDSEVKTYPGSVFRVNYTVQNTGDETGTVEIRLKDAGGTIVDTNTHVLGGGESVSSYVEAIAPSDIGSYNYTLEAYNVSEGTLDDSKSVTVTVALPISESDSLTFSSSGAVEPAFTWVKETDTLTFSSTASLESATHEVIETDSLTFSSAASLELVTIGISETDSLTFKGLASLERVTRRVTETDKITFSSTAKLESVTHEVIETDSLTFSSTGEIKLATHKIEEVDKIEFTGKGFVESITHKVSEVDKITFSARGVVGKATLIEEEVLVIEGYGSFSEYYSGPLPPPGWTDITELFAHMMGMVMLMSGYTFMLMSMKEFMKRMRELRRPPPKKPTRAEEFLKRLEELLRKRKK